MVDKYKSYNMKEIKQKKLCNRPQIELLILCREPGLNQRPPDLQSGALPTELSRRHSHIVNLY